jgi:hypothetical protein
MARPSNPNNRYTLTCKVTGKAIPTNPKQVKDLMDRYEISMDELENSYISREGRNIIKGENLTKDDAITKYGIHPQVADCLKCLNPNKKVARKRKETETETQAVTSDPIEANESETEQESDETVCFVNSEETADATDEVTA